MGVAYTFRPRESARNGAEYGSRLQRGILIKDEWNILPILFCRVAGFRCGRMLLVRLLHGIADLS